MSLIYFQENKQMSEQQTCGGCPHLAFGDIGGLKSAFCAFGRDDGDGPIVPHSAELEGGVRGGLTVLTLKRVPLECPRPDGEVHKRPIGAYAKKSQWATLRV